MGKKILILGINGFIGSNLAEKILQHTDWEIYGMDLDAGKLGNLVEHERCHFVEGDILINKEWIEYHIKKCDVILPLVAIATPLTYVQDPMRVFELDFEANLEIVRQCVKYKKRVVFPSTSEVYGMSPDTEFNEETSPLMQGPIAKERWIYSSSKQLMDRIIYAYGTRGQLQFTLFRPFNWIGPKQDDVHSQANNSRVVTQFISNVIYGRDLQLVDGGVQKRCFTYIDDGIEGLMKIIENKDNCANSHIINIGNPSNNATIKEVAETVLACAKNYPKYQANLAKIKIVSTDSGKFYGSGYQDVQLRVPSIKNAEKYLGWKPHTTFKDAIRLTVDYYLR